MHDPKSVKLGYICFSNLIRIFISGRILERLLPNQYIFYVLPVIYYESDIQTEINITFLKVSDSLWRLYRAADLPSTLHLTPSSICFNTDIVFHQHAATICSGVLVLSSIDWIYYKDHVLILKGKIRICQMSVYKVDLLSVAHWVVPWRKERKKNVFTAIPGIIGVLYNHQLAASLWKTEVNKWTLFIFLV